MSNKLYFGDFYEGQTFASESCLITKAEIISYAKQYDPQYFHVDEEAAKNSHVGKLFASGWLIASISMRLKLGTDLGRVAGGLVGMGLDSLKWLKPVYAEDVLHVQVTVIEKRLSNSKPTHGVVKYKVETINQNNETVSEAIAAVWMPVKPSTSR